MKEFIVAVEEEELEEESGVVEFTLIDKVQDGTDDEGKPKYKDSKRVLKAHPPTTGQMAFLLAATGRGQTNEMRFAGIINIMLSSLDEGDADYLEGRLLTRDPKRKLGMKQIESIFEYLTEEWFGHPTEESSDSAGS